LFFSQIRTKEGKGTSPHEEGYPKTGKEVDVSSTGREHK